MSREAIVKLIDDLVITVTNSAVVKDLNDFTEINSKHKAIVDKKKEIVEKLTALLINQ